MQNIVIALLASLLSIFLFMILFYCRPSNIKAVFKKDHKRRPSIDIKGLSSIKEDIGVLIEKYGDLKILKFKIKDRESLLIFRILLSVSIAASMLTTGFFSGVNLIVLSIIAGIIAFFLPLVLVLKRIRSISSTVGSELPEIADLLSSLVGAGLTIDESIYYIAKNYRGHISFLFKHARNMVLDGESLKNSLESISRMSFCKEFKILINTVLQAEAVGNPISNVLKNMSKTIRARQRDAIKTRAERLESNLMIVVFVFLFLPMIALFLLPVIPQLQILF